MAPLNRKTALFYNARDMAVARAYLGGFPVVLVSATPSLETLTNVAAERYQCLKLPNRHGGAQLPTVELLDMRADPPERGRWLAGSLVTLIETALKNGEQAMLFPQSPGLCAADPVPRLRPPAGMSALHRLDG